MPLLKWKTVMIADPIHSPRSRLRLAAAAVLVYTRRRMIGTMDAPGADQLIIFMKTVQMAETRHPGGLTDVESGRS